jgi:hypothetical protein
MPVAGCQATPIGGEEVGADVGGGGSDAGIDDAGDGSGDGGGDGSGDGASDAGAGDGSGLWLFMHEAASIATASEAVTRPDLDTTVRPLEAGCTNHDARGDAV